MSDDGGTLESLQGVDRYLIDKLEGAGIQSISDLATTTAAELIEDYKLELHLGPSFLLARFESRYGYRAYLLKPVRVHP